MQRALDGVYGVDLNPYAVAIARFRLLLAALKACGIERLADAPDFRVHVAAGDCLLHGHRFGARDLGRWRPTTWAAAAWPTPTPPRTWRRSTRILGQRYHAVVGNPPYITVKDQALNGLYRAALRQPAT